MTTKPSRQSAAATGTVNGRVITLDAPVPALEGKRVRVLLRPAEEPEQPLDPEQQAALWKEWVDHGEQGPLSGEADEFP